MSERIASSFILAIGMVLSVSILTFSKGIRFSVSVPRLQLEIPSNAGNELKCQNGRYVFKHEYDDLIHLSTYYCQDTFTGIEYIRQCGSPDKWNRFYSVDYKTGNVRQIKDLSGNETSH